MEEKRIVDYLWIGMLLVLFFILTAERLIENEILDTKFYSLCIIAIMIVIFINIHGLEDKIKKLGDKD